MKSENGTWQSGKNDDEVRETDAAETQTLSDLNEETGQPPVVGASTTEEVVIEEFLPFFLYVRIRNALDIIVCLEVVYGAVVLKIKPKMK